MGARQAGAARVAVGSLAAAFSVLLSWYYQPYVAAENAPNVAGASPFSAGLFDLRGPAFIGWTLAAFAIGALAGMLIRRIVACDRRHPRHLHRICPADGERIP